MNSPSEDDDYNENENINGVDSQFVSIVPYLTENSQLMAEPSGQDSLTFVDLIGDMDPLLSTSEFDNLLRNDSQLTNFGGLSLPNSQEFIETETSDLGIQIRNYAMEEDSQVLVPDDVLNSTESQGREMSWRGSGSTEEEYEPPLHALNIHDPDAPCLENWSGDLNFHVAVEQGSTKKTLYCDKRNKIYCTLNSPLPFKITLDYARCTAKDFKIVTTMVFTDPENCRKPVLKCFNHMEMEKKIGKDIPKDQLNSVVRCMHSGAEYVQSDVTERVFCYMDVEHPKPGCNYMVRNLCFTCAHSCKTGDWGGAQRRLTALIFYLIDANQTVYGRSLMYVRVCSAPFRDYKKEEEDSAKQEQKKANVENEPPKKPPGPRPKSPKKGRKPKKGGGGDDDDCRSSRVAKRVSNDDNLKSLSRPNKKIKVEQTEEQPCCSKTLKSESKSKPKPPPREVLKEENFKCERCAQEYRNGTYQVDEEELEAASAQPPGAESDFDSQSSSQETAYSDDEPTTKLKLKQLFRQCKRCIKYRKSEVTKHRVLACSLYRALVTAKGICEAMMSDPDFEAEENTTSPDMGYDDNENGRDLDEENEENNSDGGDGE